MRKGYAIKHWFFTLLLAPLTAQIISLINTETDYQSTALLNVYPLTVMFSLVFSIPTFLVYIAYFYFLSKKDVHCIVVKLILITISVLGIYITQKMIEGSLRTEIIIGYSATSLIIGLSLKLKISKTTIRNNENK